jgi:hypothetical protein
MLAYVIIFGILIGACYWIINPLLQEENLQNGFTPKPGDLLEKLKNKKDGVYATIRELEFDLSMGKLSEEDFQILKRQYVQEAAGYMQEMDKLESSLFTALPVARRRLLRVDSVLLAGQIYTNTTKIISRRKIEKKN